MTLVAAVLLLQLRIPALTYLPSAVVPTVIATLNETVAMCLWFAALNLVPLPPLTGMHLLVAVRPSLAPILTKYQVYASLALAALALAGVVQPALQPARDVIAGLLAGL
jgi:Zn-dependent protease